LTLFEYDSARTVNNVADMAKLLACLEDNEVIDMANSLCEAFDVARDYSYGVHTANLVLIDLWRVVLFAEASEWLRLIRAPAHRIVLKAAGMDGKIPLVQDGKWNTEVQSLLFYRQSERCSSVTSLNRRGRLLSSTTTTGSASLVWSSTT
jgi:hypothetical protein